MEKLSSAAKTAETKPAPEKYHPFHCLFLLYHILEFQKCLKKFEALPPLSARPCIDGSHRSPA